MGIEHKVMWTSRFFPIMARDVLCITGFFLAMPLSLFFPEFFLVE